MFDNNEKLSWSDDWETPVFDKGQSLQPCRKNQPPLNYSATTGKLTISGKPIVIDQMRLCIGSFRKCLGSEYQEGRGKNRLIFDDWEHAAAEGHDHHETPLVDIYEIHGVFVKPAEIAEPAFFAKWPLDANYRVCSFRWLVNSWTHKNCIKYGLDALEPSETVQTTVWEFGEDKQSGYFAPRLTQVATIDEITAAWVWNISKNW